MGHDWDMSRNIDYYGEKMVVFLLERADVVYPEKKDFKLKPMYIYISDSC